MAAVNDGEAPLAYHLDHLVLGGDGGSSPTERVFGLVLRIAHGPSGCLDAAVPKMSRAVFLQGRCDCDSAGYVQRNYGATRQSRVPSARGAMRMGV